MFRNILSIGLALFIVAAGHPVIQKDCSVLHSGQGLKDSIQAVANLSYSAETSTDFKTGLGHALSALNEAAGLTQVISSQNDTAYHGVQGADFLFLPSRASGPGINKGVAPILEQAFPFSIHNPAPPFRPPRALPPVLKAL